MDQAHELSTHPCWQPSGSCCLSMQPGAALVPRLGARRQPRVWARSRLPAAVTPGVQRLKASESHHRHLSRTLKFIARSSQCSTGAAAEASPVGAR